jgi:hypothetical protein
VRARRFPAKSSNAWLPLGAGLPSPVSALFRRADGSLVVRAAIPQSTGGNVSMLLAWHGVVWLPVVFPTNGSVDGLLDLANGDVVVHGTFTTAGGVPAQGLARRSGSTWSPLGVGVPPGQGIGRVLELQSLDLLAIGSFGSIGGVQTRGIARCTLLVAPDFGELALVTADVYDTSFAVPNVPTLVGVVLHQQLLFAELDANAVPIRSSSTNGLTVTIGAF